MRGRLGSLLKRVLGISLPIVLLLFLLTEVVLRTAIPASRVPLSYFDEEYRILKYDPALPKGVHTLGRLGQERAVWRINDEGWNSSIEFLPPAERSGPLIAVIGDSYVEGLQADVDDTVGGVLRRLAGDRADVYAFGRSGAPLSHYLHVSRYVAEEFDPDVLVFVVIHNDFSESVNELERKTHFMQVTKKSGSWQETSPASYTPDKLRRLAGRSAIVRYLMLNLKISGTLQRRAHIRETLRRFEANVDTDAVRAKQDIITDATHHILQEIREEHPRREILFAIDGRRSQIYEGGESEIHWLHEMLAREAAAADSHFLDLTEPFTEHYRAHGQPFNSTLDFHWNALGHEIVAKAVMSYLERESIVTD